MTASNRDIESFLLLKEMGEQKRKIERILCKYNVDTIEALERLVNERKVPEHPAYEDLLDVLALKNSMEETKSVFKALIEAY